MIHPFGEQASRALVTFLVQRGTPETLDRMFSRHRSGAETRSGIVIAGHEFKAQSIFILEMDERLAIETLLHRLVLYVELLQPIEPEADRSTSDREGGHRHLAVAFPAPPRAGK